MKEAMHRFKYTKLASVQIAKKFIPTTAGSRCAPAYTVVPAGKSFKIVTGNGPMLNNGFNHAGTLTLAGGC